MIANVKLGMLWNIRGWLAGQLAGMPKSVQIFPCRLC